MKYKEIFEKPLDEIKEDIFFRTDNFKKEKWYSDLLVYKSIGVCTTNENDIDNLQKALKILGYKTKRKVKDNKIYLIPCKEKTRDINLER